jgi:hypothetical protein
MEFPEEEEKKIGFKVTLFNYIHKILMIIIIIITIPYSRMKNSYHWLCFWAWYQIFKNF